MNSFIHHWLTQVKSTIRLIRNPVRRPSRRDRWEPIAIAVEVTETRLQLSAVGGLLPVLSSEVVAALATVPANNATPTNSAGSTAANVASNLNSGQIISNGTSAIPSTLNSSSVTPDPAENNPKDFAEDLALSHLHAHNGNTSSHSTQHSTSGTSGIFAMSSTINTTLAAVSTFPPSVPVLNPADKRSLTGTNADSSATFSTLTRKQSDDSGLIDITESRTTKSARRPVIDSGAAESDSPGTPSESSLIAARVAQTVRQSQRRTALPPAAAPSFFATTADGGLIELVAMATDRNPATRGEKPLKTLTRHDQVDAELGHFAGFDGADVFGSSALGVAIPKRIAPTDSPDAADSHATSSTNRLPWGLLLSAGTAMALWRTPVRTRQMAQTWLRSLTTRCRQAAKVLTTR